MKKYLFPWKIVGKFNNKNLYKRADLVSESNSVILFFGGIHFEWIWYIDEKHYLKSKTSDNAKIECDKGLIKLGYVFLTEQQANLS